jgi:heme-degrading monooxygenase HmoA
MIAIVNSLPVKDGAVGQNVERFAESRGQVQGFPGFVSTEVLKCDTGDEGLAATRWQDRDSFNA